MDLPTLSMCLVISFSQKELQKYFFFFFFNISTKIFPSRASKLTLENVSRFFLFSEMLKYVRRSSSAEQFMYSRLSDFGGSSEMCVDVTDAVFLGKNA